jgi:putative redox protein
VHAVDCAECETTAAYIDRIEWSFELAGNLTDEQRTRLLDIAQRCPVHRTLISVVDIRPPDVGSTTGKSGSPAGPR